MKEKQFIIFIILIFLLISCNQGNITPPTLTSTTTPVPLPTMTAISSSTATATQTVTPTNITTPTQTSTITPTVTLPPLEDQIAFISDRDNGKSIIYRMNSDGSGVNPLAEISGSYFSGHDSPFAFSWSPDGRWIAYISDESTGSAFGDILIVDVYGTSVKNLTNTPEVNEDLPIWSPDGKWIAYVVDNTVHLLNVVSLQSEQVAEILPTSADITQLSWSPDSSILTFLAEGYAVNDSEIFSSLNFAQTSGLVLPPK